MPALPAVPNVLRIALGFDIGTDLTALCRIYYSYTGTAPDDTACATIGGDIGTAIGAHLTALMPNSNSSEFVEVTDLSSAVAGTGIFTFHQPGTRGAAELPANACVLQNSAIGRRYRGGKPRTYWPFGIESDLANAQTWLTGSVTAFQNALIAFYTALSAIVVSGTSLVDQVNISYYEHFIAVTNPITGRTRDVPTLRVTPLVDVVQHVTVNPNVSSQRRRTLIRH